MIQLIWWPESISCARAEKMRIAAEKAATEESARRAEDAPQAEKAKCITWEALNATPPPGKLIGRLATRDSKAITSSRWSVGCETMDRDYAVFKNYRAYIGGTGVKNARIQSGWEKTEPKRGVYDFAWFDEHVRGIVAEMGALSAGEQAEPLARGPQFTHGVAECGIIHHHFETGGKEAGGPLGSAGSSPCHGDQRH